MSQAKDFFRICPACGRRFHITLVDSRLVDERKSTQVIKHGVAASTSVRNVRIVTVEEDSPVTFDVRDFQYTYRCKHCGHTWSELRVRKSRL